MNSIQCPSCGEPLAFDVLSGEPRPCAKCGAVPPVDENGKILRDADQQQTINRQKYFEIATVIILIIVGFGYLAISTGRSPDAGDGTTTITNHTAILLSDGYDQAESTRAMGQRFHSFRLRGDTLLTSVDLVSADDGERTQLIIFSVGLPSEKAMPSDDEAATMVQEAFDAVAELGERLVRQSTQGLSKAVNTTVAVTNDDTRFHKGVAQTSSGWKITYVAYREVDEEGDTIPLLLFIYQRLDAASDPALEPFNHVLFSAANDGKNIRQAMMSESTGDALGN